MKILIPLTILVLSFIIYYFFYVPVTAKETEHIDVDIQPISFKKEKEPVRHDYISNLATIKTVPIEKKSAPQKEYLSLDDLRHNRSNFKQNSKQDTLSSQQSYNQMIFEQLKTILQQASSTYYAKKHIVLNSHIASILTSQSAKEKFKALLASDFGLDDETINQELKHNRTVWDWVIFLSP